MGVGEVEKICPAPKVWPQLITTHSDTGHGEASETRFFGEFYWDDGKDNGNYYNNIGVIGIMEKKNGNSSLGFRV